MPGAPAGEGDEDGERETKETEAVLEDTGAKVEAHQRGTVRTGGADSLVVREEEDGAGSADSAEEEKKRDEHELKGTKAWSKCKDRVAGAHPSGRIKRARAPSSLLNSGARGGRRRRGKQCGEEGERDEALECELNRQCSEAGGDAAWALTG